LCVLFIYEHHWHAVSDNGKVHCSVLVFFLYLIFMYIFSDISDFSAEYGAILVLLIRSAPSARLRQQLAKKHAAFVEALF